MKREKRLPPKRAYSATALLIRCSLRSRLVVFIAFRHFLLYSRICERSQGPPRQISRRGHKNKEAPRTNPRLFRKWRLPPLPQRSAVPSAMLSLSRAPRPSAPPPPHVSDLSPTQSHCLYLGSELNKVFCPPHVCFYNICLNLYILGSHLNILLGPFFFWEILHISYPPVL